MAGEGVETHVKVKTMGMMNPWIQTDRGVLAYREKSLIG